MSSIRIDGASPQNIAQTFSNRDSGSVGTWKGEAVKVMDTGKSVLQDAAEEITMSHSDKAESKKLDERKGKVQSSMDLQKLEEIVKYLEQMHGEKGKEKLEDTAKRILERKGEGSKPRDEARRSFQDVTEQFFALSYAARRGEELGADADRMDQIHEAILELGEDFGPKIRAGMAAAAGAREAAIGADGAAQFRETYRDVVLGEADLAKTFDTVLERHGLADFPRIVPGLIKSLGEDLQAVRPSREPERMQAILQDLYNLEVAITILDSAKALAESMQRRQQQAHV